MLRARGGKMRLRAVLPEPELGYVDGHALAGGADVIVAPVARPT